MLIAGLEWENMFDYKTEKWEIFHTHYVSNFVSVLILVVNVVQ